MNSKLKNIINELKIFIVLWLTQALSSLGSSMTTFALIIWSYQQQGSAMVTALLSVCSYAPYVLLSIFAGSLSDKWNKKITMLVCDSVAAVCTLIVLIFLKTDRLEIWHLYLLNGINGLMNTVQQPAADVSTTLLISEKYYQKASAMKSFSNSLTSILTPVIAMALLGFGGTDLIIAFDLCSFTIAFISLVFFIRIPEAISVEERKEKLLDTVKSGLDFLKQNVGILQLILFLSTVNLVASICDAALPAMLLSRNGGSTFALGAVNTCIGIANILGSIYVVFSKPPKSRVRVICNTLLVSLGTQNFFMAFGKSTPIWCIGSIMGWIVIPIMSANLDVLLRSNIPVEMQGRVYAIRNAFQYFTIPIGFFLGGYLIDYVFEPWMAIVSEESILIKMFGAGKGSGAAVLFLIIGVVGVVICLVFRKLKAMWTLEQIIED